MDNFEALIAEALDKGQSMEDIARQFTDTLNKVDKQKNSKEAYINELKDRIDHSVANDRYTLENGVAMITVALCSEGGACSSFSKEQAEDFYNDGIKTFEETMKVVGVMNDLAKELDTDTDAEENKCSRNKKDISAVEGFLKAILEEWK